MKKIITISGKAKSGKDYLAELLVSELRHEMKRAVVIKYADYLKYIATQFFNWNGEKDILGRTLLQQLGTDIVRSREPNYWVDTVMNFIKVFDMEFDYFIISDTRFPNEILVPRERFPGKTYSLIVKRYNKDSSPYDNGLTKEQKYHPSEIALDTFSEFDGVVFNYGIPEEMISIAKKIARDLITNQETIIYSSNAMSIEIDRKLGR